MEKHRKLASVGVRSLMSDPSCGLFNRSDKRYFTVVELTRYFSADYSIGFIWFVQRNRNAFGFNRGIVKLSSI